MQRQQLTKWPPRRHRNNKRVTWLTSLFAVDFPTPRPQYSVFCGLWCESISGDHHPLLYYTLWPVLGLPGCCHFKLFGSPSIACFAILSVPCFVIFYPTLQDFSLRSFVTVLQIGAISTAGVQMQNIFAPASSEAHQLWYLKHGECMSLVQKMQVQPQIMVVGQDYSRSLDHTGWALRCLR